MIFTSRSIKKLGFSFLLVIFLLALTNSVFAYRNVCKDCNLIASEDARRCENCQKPFNKCLKCQHENPANIDFCEKCNTPLAEMRILGSINSDVREDLRLGESSRAKMDLEIQKLNHLLKLEPEKADIYLFRLAKLYQQMKFYAKECSAWQEYLEKFPNTDKKAIIEAYLSESLRKLAYLFYNQKNFASATASLEEATTRNPANAEAWRWLGRVSMETGDKEKAKDAYRKALQAEPDDKTSKHFLRKLGAKKK